MIATTAPTLSLLQGPPNGPPPPAYPQQKAALMAEAWRLSGSVHATATGPQPPAAVPAEPLAAGLATPRAAARALAPAGPTTGDAFAAAMARAARCTSAEDTLRAAYAVHRSCRPEAPAAPPWDELVAHLAQAFDDALAGGWGHADADGGLYRDLCRSALFAPAPAFVLPSLLQGHAQAPSPRAATSHEIVTEAQMRAFYLWLDVAPPPPLVELYGGVRQPEG